MTGEDIQYFEACFGLGLVKAPFLEVGSAKVQGDRPNLCDLALKHGVSPVFGVDLQAAPGVSFTADFSLPAGQFCKNWDHGQFATVAIFNVLEHTFDPLTVLTNALSCVADGGVLVVVAPAVWPIHNYPRDYNRLLPNWFETFARLNGVQLHKQAFCWISQFGITDVAENKSGELYHLPTAATLGRRRAPVRYWTSRIVHCAFHTFGLSHTLTRATLGAAFVRA